jgi:type I restriction enzyme S subunit
MKRYDSYKDSGVEVIGMVPSHWNKTKFKFNHIESDQRVENSWTDYQLLSLTKQGIITRDIESGKGKFPESFETYKKVENGDVIFCLYDIDETPRTVGMSNVNGMITGSYKIFRTIDILPKFTYYTFLSIDDVKGLKPYYTGLRNVIRPETFKSLPFHFPPLSEQQQIVSYLDTKTSLIDSLIEKTQRKIELLKEKRTSIINKVVTKGLNPNVEMTDSGVEWIGKIPSHWEIVSLGKIGVLYGGLTGKIGDDFRSDDHPLNKPFIPFTNIFNNTYISKNHFQYVVVGDNENQNRVEKFDLFFLMSSEDYDDLGKSSILIEEVSELYLNSFCKGFRVKKKGVFPLFLNYQLLSYNHKTLISIEGNGFTRINLRQDRLKETPLFIPPLPEQKEIVSYLDEQTQLFDKTISIEEKRIELLKEYRQSITSEVVTGKFDVRVN